jgi:hypothetical protein
MPVCGCDGVQYANSCVADCADVPWTPAVPNGTLGGFLPCNQPSTCEVEISGDSILCSWGSPQVLTAVPSGNGTPPYTYSWSNGQSNSPILTIIVPGTYCVTVTDANGCVDSACFTVAVQEIPIYTNPSPPVICNGDSIVMEIDTAGLNNIIWVPTGANNTINRVVDYPLIPTTYVIEALDASGCDRRGEVFVQVDTCNNGPCAIPFLEVEHDTITNMLEANQISSNFSYQWTNGDTTYNTSYYANWCLYVVDLNGCDTTICDITTSLFENIESNIKIYPNPARSNMIFELPQGENFNLQVFDISGKLVLSEERVMNKFMIDNNYLSNGTYIMQLIHNSGLITEKIIFE